MHPRPGLLQGSHASHPAATAAHSRACLVGADMHAPAGLGLQQEASHLVPVPLPEGMSGVDDVQGTCTAKHGEGAQLTLLDTVSIDCLQITEMVAIVTISDIM